MNSVERINPSGNVVEFAFVLFAPRFRSAEPRFFGAGQDNADFGVFKFDTLVFHRFKDRDAHKASRKVVVCAVNRRLGIPHAVHTEIEGNECKVCDAKPEQNAVFGFKNHRLAFRDDCRRKAASHKEQRAKDNDNDVRFVNFAAELIVDRPVPRCVGVTVEKYATFDFARAFLDCGNVRARLFGEQEIESLFVKTELHYHYVETENDKRKT